MIISASRRTDIPAFFSAWLEHRIQEGYCLVPNPYNRRQVARVSLRPADVDAWVLWTRHARPAFRVVEQMRAQGTPVVCLYTITGYGPPLEPHTPSVATATSTFRELAQRLPPGAVVWRYDPILLGEAFSVADHLDRFRNIAGLLRGSTERVVISLLQPYQKTRRRVGAVLQWGKDVSESVDATQVSTLLTGLAEVATAHELQIEACCPPEDWSALGVAATRCIDPDLLARVYGGKWPQRKDPGQRPNCGCVMSKDIGMPNTCGFGCTYCYATVSDRVADANRARHHVEGESLIPPAIR